MTQSNLHTLFGFMHLAIVIIISTIVVVGVLVVLVLGLTALYISYLLKQTLIVSYLFK